MKFNLNIEDKSENIIKIKKMFGISENNFKKIMVPPNIKNIKNSNIVVIVGASGTGKTTLGKYIKKKLGYIENDMKFNYDKAIIDSLGGSFKKNLYYLNMVGLSEAFLYLTPYKFLSEGQKFRFEIAYLMLQNRDYILIDEFCSLLDNQTSEIVSYNLQKIIRKYNKHVVIITSNKKLCKFLMPDVNIEFNDFGSCKLKYNFYKAKYDILSNFKVKKGNYKDFKLLEKFHYFGDVKFKTLKRRDAKYYSLYQREDLVGVIITTSPYQKSKDGLDYEFKKINESIRVIFRLILHPKVRGIGATKILYNEVIKNEKYVIFLRSALAKQYPFPRKLNMTELDYDNITNFNEYYKLLDMKTYSDERAFLYGRYILAKIMDRDFKKYVEMLKIDTNKGLSFFYNVVKILFNDVSDLELLVDIIKPLEMSDYYFDNRELK